LGIVIINLGIKLKTTWGGTTNCDREKMATNCIKKFVSKQKRRFEEQGFNLDLSYVTPRVIAMGYPSEKVESVYRNSLEDVRRFLETRHANHYKVYNLCSEKSYDVRKFNSMVAIYPFDDHSPPEFSLLKPFCLDVLRWLSADPNNIAAVHCKAGKGRTGLMICAYLLHSGYIKGVENVLNYYASKRTFDCKGVTLPSQRRYVAYFASKLERDLEYSPVKMLLTQIRIKSPPSLGAHRAHIQVQVHQKLAPHFDSELFPVVSGEKEVVANLSQPLLLNGDVKMVFMQKTSRLCVTNNGKICHFWINTCFLAQGESTELTHAVAMRGTGLGDGLEKADMGCGEMDGGWVDRGHQDFEEVMVPVRNRFQALKVEASPKARSDHNNLAAEGDILVRLNKSQIDKAAANDKFPEGFVIELLLKRWNEENTAL